MTDVGDRPETAREAVASCSVATSDPGLRDRLLAGEVEKGSSAASVVAGMLAAKRVPELIPSCHPVRTSFIGVELQPAGANRIEVRATVRGVDRTGFEMEALTAAAVAALTLYDMGKGADPGIRITDLRLVAKSGGASGSWREP